MPWSKRKSRKLATQTGTALSFIAGITINLITAWFQQSIVNNLLLLTCVIIILIAVGYSIKKMRSTLLTGAFVFLVVSLFINLFSNWFQAKLVQNFTISNVTVFFLFTVICLVLGALIASHPISRFENWMRKKFRNNARNKSKVRLAALGMTSNNRRRQTSRWKSRRS